MFRVEPPTNNITSLSIMKVNTSSGWELLRSDILLANEYSNTMVIQNIQTTKLPRTKMFDNGVKMFAVVAFVVLFGMEILNPEVKQML